MAHLLVWHLYICIYCWARWKILLLFSWELGRSVCYAVFVHQSLGSAHHVRTGYRFQHLVRLLIDHIILRVPEHFFSNFSLRCWLKLRKTNHSRQSHLFVLPILVRARPHHRRIRTQPYRKLDFQPRSVGNIRWKKKIFEKPSQSRRSRHQFEWLWLKMLLGCSEVTVEWEIRLSDTQRRNLFSVPFNSLHSDFLCIK